MRVFFYVFVLHTVYCVVLQICIALCCTMCIVLCCVAYSLPLAILDSMKIKHNHNDNLSGWVLNRK